MLKINKFIFIVLLAFNISSCNNISNPSLEIELFRASKVEMPKNLYVLINGRDTILDIYNEARLKMVVYIDSVSCTSCSISKMFFWDKYIKYSNQNNKEFKLNFIFNSKDIFELKRSFMIYQLNYPVFIDSIGEFERLNPHLPKNPAMHTFLLDEDNNVILVGNPLHNKEIEKMFYQEVEKRLK